MLCLRSFFSRQQGVAAVEFAFVAPVALALLFAFVEGGRLYFTRSMLDYATQEAGRYVMLNIAADDSTIITYAKNKLVGVDPEAVTASVANQTIGGKAYKNITLTTPFSSVVGEIIPWHNLTITASSTVPTI